MSAVISNLTAAALLLHALLGCCWHHTHACLEGGPTTMALSGQEADSHPGGCAGCHDHDRPAQGHPHPDKCNGPRCALDTNLATKTPQANLQAIVATARLAMLPTCDDCSPRGGCSLLAAGRDRPPALRTHLLNQVLLI